MPETMLAGHHYAVSVTFRNAGSNTWTSASYYNLGSANDNGAWGVYRAALPTSIGPNGEVTFNFTVTAPTTPGTYNFQWRMVQDYVEWFGATSTNLPITITGAPGNGGNAAECVWQSVPPIMAAGQSYAASVRMKNTGSNTWTTANHYNLGSANDNGAWGLYRVALPNAIAPGQEVTFNFTVTAPVTPGNYAFKWRMVQDYVEWFGDESTNVQVIVNSSGLRTQTSVKWLVSDQLGTPRIIIDQSGNLSNVSRHDYLPFGEEIGAGVGGRDTAQGYTAGDNVRQKFTSKERDGETGLDYSINRYYSATQGRFASPDPTLLSLRGTNPQTLNRYAYVLNNPLLFIDPLGLWELEYEPVYEEGRTDRVKSVRVFFHKSKKGDSAETLLQQLGFKSGDKGYGAMKSQIEGAIGNMGALGIEASTLKGSVDGIDIGSTFKTVGDLLGKQANYDVELGKDGGVAGPFNQDFVDCTMTTARLSFGKAFTELGGIGNQDGPTGMDERYLSNAREAEPGDLRLLDAVRYDGNGKSKDRHYMTVVFTGDDGTSFAFSRSGKNGRFQIVPVGQFAGTSYGNIRGRGKNQTGFYRP